MSAGAPVKPSRASSAAVTPTCAPQPEPSFSIVGESHDAQDLAARTEVFGDAERVAHPRVVEAAAAARRAPRSRARSTRRSSDSRARVACSAMPGARRDLVAEHEAREELAAVDAAPARRCAPSTHASSAGSIATPACPLVSTWPSCASSASIVDAPANAAPARPARRPSNRMRASRSRPQQLRRRVGAGDRRRRRAAAGGGDADQIEQAALRLRDDVGRQRVEREIAHERENVAERLGPADEVIGRCAPMLARRSPSAIPLAPRSDETGAATIAAPSIPNHATFLELDPGKDEVCKHPSFASAIVPNARGLSGDVEANVRYSRPSTHFREPRDERSDSAAQVPAGTPRPGAGHLRRGLRVRARAPRLPAGRRVRARGRARASRSRRRSCIAISSTPAPTSSRRSPTTRIARSCASSAASRTSSRSTAARSRSRRRSRRRRGALFAGDICNTNVYDPADPGVAQGGARDVRGAGRLGGRRRRRFHRRRDVLVGAGSADRARRHQEGGADRGHHARDAPGRRHARGLDGRRRVQAPRRRRRRRRRPQLHPRPGDDDAAAARDPRRGEDAHGGAAGAVPHAARASRRSSRCATRTGTTTRAAGRFPSRSIRSPATASRSPSSGARRWRSTSAISACAAAPGPHHIRALAEAVGKHPPASKYSADMSKHAFLGSHERIKQVQKDYAGKL